MSPLFYHTGTALRPWYPHEGATVLGYELAPYLDEDKDFMENVKAELIKFAITVRYN